MDLDVPILRSSPQVRLLWLHVAENVCNYCATKSVLTAKRDDVGSADRIQTGVSGMLGIPTYQHGLALPCKLHLIYVYLSGTST